MRRRRLVGLNDVLPVVHRKIAVRHLIVPDDFSANIGCTTYPEAHAKQHYEKSKREFHTSLILGALRASMLASPLSRSPLGRLLSSRACGLPKGPAWAGAPRAAPTRR